MEVPKAALAWMHRDGFRSRSLRVSGGSLWLEMIVRGPPASAGLF